MWTNQEVPDEYLNWVKLATANILRGTDDLTKHAEKLRGWQKECDVRKARLANHLTQREIFANLPNDNPDSHFEADKSELLSN